MRARVKPEKNWISKSKFEIENEEELLACRKIILKIVRYMKDNNMNQRDLAKKLGVSPQYINKLLHGQDLDLKITTVLRYGRILGIKLIVLPEDEPDTHQGTIQYSLIGVTIEQFATLFEPSSDKVQLALSIPIRTNYSERTIAVGANIQFLEEDRPFLIAEVLCHYVIEEPSWVTLTDNYSQDATLPKDFVKSLVRIAISTLRGALCAKTENTPFAKYFLPVIEMQENQGGDVIITKTPRGI